MKKALLVLLAGLFLSTSTFSQENEQDNENQNFNEVKLNALYLVLGAFEGSYEYLLNEESGVGISLFLPIDDDAVDAINYYISPYYRFYFGNKYAAGFFLEGFGMLNSIKNDTYYFNNGTDPTFVEENITDFALGIGLGGKWVTARGLTGEINLGVGRNLFNTKEEYDNDFVGKLGITIGYRF